MNNSRLQQLTVSLALLASTLLAHAGNDGLLGISAVGTLCLAQDDANQNTPLGKMLSNDEGYKIWKESLSEKKLSCIVAEKAIPQNVCADILSLDPNGKMENTDKLLKEAQSALPKMQALEKKCAH